MDRASTLMRDFGKLRKVVQLADGGKVVLADPRSGNWKRRDCDGYQNIFRISNTGEIAWQVGPYRWFPNVSTFTNIELSDDQLVGYNFDGGEYFIDLRTGAIGDSKLFK